jgi:hypothetical protein
MMPLQRKYSAAIQLAEQADIDSPPEEYEGRLYFVGTVRAPSDVAKIWEAIRALPDWDAEVIADIRSADYGAAIMTFAARPVSRLGRVAGGLAEDDLGAEPFPVRPTG